MIHKTRQQVIDEWNEWNDVERWSHIILGIFFKGDIIIYLDNDNTSIFIEKSIFITDLDPEDGICLYFDDYIGNAQGVYDLCEAVGIKCEGV